MKYFPEPIFSKAKFEDFQKSEMIKTETIDPHGFLYTLIVVNRKNHVLILKSERTRINPRLN